MRKQALLILFLALAPGSGVQGQVTNSEIVLGAITLRLGMSQNEALAALGPVYDLRDLDGYNWLVSRRGSSMGDVGNIVFRDRTLTLVGKNWGPPSPTANQFARALYDAVRSITSGTAWTTLSNLPS